MRHHLRAARRRHPGRHDGRPAGQRAAPCRAGSTSPPRSTRPAATWTPTSSCCAPRAAGFNAGVDIKEMQHTTGFDALIGANKRLLRRVQGGLRVRGAGGRRGQRLLPRRRRRPGRQRRLHRRQRRRLLRRARGRPGRARRRHPPGPAGAPAPDAHPLLHRAARSRPPTWCQLGSRPRGGPPRPARRRRARRSPARSPPRTPG